MNSGKDIISSEDIKNAILFHRGSWKRQSVVEIDKSERSVEQSEIPNIQSFHSVQFEDNGMKFWQYFNVGNGQFIPYSELTFHSELEVISAFSTMESVIEKPKQNRPRKGKIVKSAISSFAQFLTASLLLNLKWSSCSI